VRAVYDLLTSDGASPLEVCGRLTPLLAGLEGTGPGADGRLALSAACPLREVNLAAYVPQLKQVGREGGRAAPPVMVGGRPLSWGAGWTDSGSGFVREGVLLGY
jgi:hypothetical protein